MIAWARRAALVAVAAVPAFAPGAAAEPRIDLQLSGYVQSDAVAWSQASVDEVDEQGEPLNETRFLIRRARLRAEARRSVVGASFEIDGNTSKGSALRLVSAEASFRCQCADDLPPAIMATVGLFKTPFGFEAQESTPRRIFLEPSNVVRALFPGEYDLGLRVTGAWHELRWSLAAMNGHPVGEQDFPGRDPSAGKDLMGRGGVDAQVAPGVRVQAGLSLLVGRGFHAGTPASKDVFVWVDTNEDGRVQTTELQVIPGSPATASEEFDRFALGGDARVSVTIPRVGELLVAGEMIWSGNLDRGLRPADPTGAGRDLRELGWTAAVVQHIRGVALVGVRYDRYDPDADATDQQGADLVPIDASFSTLALVGAWILPEYGKVTVEYDHNTNSLGRDESGMPATLASDRLTVRAQVTF